MKRERLRPGAALAVQILLLVLGWGAALLLFFGRFAFEDRLFLTLMLCGVAALFALYCAATPRKVKWLVTPVVVLLWALVGWVTWEHLVPGAFVAAGYITPDLGLVVTQRFIAPPPYTPLGAWQGSWFTLYILAPYSCLLAWTAAAQRSAVVSLALSVPFLGFVYFVGGLQFDLPVIVLFAFWITLFLQPRLPAREKEAGVGIPLLSMVASGLAVCLLLALVPAVGYQTAPGTIELRDGIVRLARRVDRAASRDTVLGSYSSGAPLTSSGGSVNLGSMRSIEFPDMDVMQVRSEQPHHLYLRGYSASVYTGQAWQQADHDTFGGSGVEFAPIAYLEQHGDTYYGVGPYRITVEQYQQSDLFQFLPYRYAGSPESAAAPVWTGDAFAAADGVSGHSYYSYGGAGLDGILTDADGIDLLRYLESNSAGQYGQLEYNGYAYEYYATLSGVFLYAPIEYPEEATAAAYRHLSQPPGDLDTIELFYPDELPDKEYLQYLVAQYTELPDGVGEALRQWWADTAPGDGEIPAWMLGGYASSSISYSMPEPSEHTPYWQWALTARLVSDRIKSSGSYNTAPGAQPEDEDFAVYFLTESNQGYCVHFATATVAVLRSMGVPARYVEGYVVGASSFDSEGVAEVPASSAHAWAEIWLPNYGWVPVDATPGGSALGQGVITLDEAEPDETEPDELDEPEEPETSEPEAEESEAEESSAPDEPERSQGPQQPEESGPDEEWQPPSADTVLRRVLIGAGVLLVVYLLARWRVRRWRERTRGWKSHNRAALHLYDYMVRLAAQGAVIPEASTSIALKAKFSRHEITAEELVVMRKDLAACQKGLRRYLSVPRRFALWLRGLL